ncbi:DNA sulfur modification protein DndB [Asticcacaulis sp.]|uniref:DNA sulfur modification protein DndB n=1 Tax=Asticcacaulis sp. TaxID=1872648 RepID=UPI00260F3E8C|nr:DNA sulfur modification protein DndB [Asticcacaulis sp.]
MTSPAFKKPGSDRPHYTEARPILCGTINLAGSEIPFFQAMMPIGEVVKQLDLVENLPSDLRAKWRLEELFQREIDWERVKEDLVKGYLKRPNKLKFFSTLTVALLPLDENGMLAGDYGAIDKGPIPLDWANEPEWRTADIGRVQLIRDTSGPGGALRWDPHRVFAATIDGQHRLAALKTLVLEGGLSSKAMESQLSVMFLILDPRAGFNLAPGQVADGENPILTVVREIFIDLNMHSKTVARARQILLSDQDIEAKCLRELIGTRVGVVEDGRLPLGLIHWQNNESAKFNVGEKTGPFITTVELLYAVIKDVLDLKRPKDPLDGDSVRKFVSSIEAALDVSKHIQAHEAKYGLPPLMSYVEEHHLKEGFETPFPNPTAPYIRACADSFSKIWRQLFLDVFTKFKPYADFITEVEKRGGIDGDIASYIVLPVKAQKSKREEWGEDAPKKIDQPLQELAKMKGDDWAFYAVFQKALFRATKIAFQHYDVTPRYTHRTFSEAWVSFLNTLSDRGLLKVKAKHDGAPVWAGIGLSHANHTITWSEAAVARICSLLVLWWYFHLYALNKSGAFLTKVSGNQGAEKYPGCKEAQRSVMKGLEAWAKYIDPAIVDNSKKVSARAADRLKELLVLAKDEKATDENDDISIPPTDAGEGAMESADSGDTTDDGDLEDTEVSGPDQVM